MKLTQVVIDRAKWGRAALLNTRNKMCCLGFCAKSAGIPAKEMKNVGMPMALINLEPMLEKFPLLFDDTGWGVHYSSKIAMLLADANDGMVAGVKKEATIKAIGKKAGIQFVFTGEY